MCVGSEDVGTLCSTCCCEIEIDGNQTEGAEKDIEIKAKGFEN